MRKKRGLGRGLDALIGATSEAERDADIPQLGELRILALDQIRPGSYQPRRDFDQQSLAELAESIKSQGLVQPIVVRPAVAGQFEIVAGERRWRAARIAGLEEIPASVRAVDDQAAMALALIENIQREDLNVIEEAAALQRLQREFSLTHEELATVLGKSRTTITNLLRLLQLEPGVRDLLENGRLDMGHARALLALSGDHQSVIASEVVKKGLSVRDTEALVRRTLQAPSATKPKPEPDPDIQRLERQLAESTGARVQISHRSSGKGKLTFDYNSLEELQGLLEHFEPFR